MRYLTLNEVLEVHRQVMAQSGGAEGLMHLPALESALAQPQMTCCGTNGEIDEMTKTSRIDVETQRAIGICDAEACHTVHVKG